MFLALTAVLSMLAPAGSGTLLPPVGSDASGQGGVKLILNRAEFWTGDPVKVQVEAGEDGYLVVMRVDGDGRVRVVFPIDPDLDPFVRGGKRYELRGREANESFRADDLGGAGIVFAALSKDPLHFEDFSVGGHWDYEALRLGDLQNDPEAALHRFVRRMSADARYSFDVQGYRVLNSAVASGTYSPVYIGVRDPYHRCYTCGFGDPWYGGGIHFGVSIGIGSVRDPWDPWYDPYWNTGFWYDPYWAYGASPWYPPYYPGQYAPYTVINSYRPPRAPNPHAGERARPRVAIAPAIAPPIGTVSGVVPRRTAAPAPVPAPQDGRARPRTPQGSSGGDRGAQTQPPAVTAPVPAVPSRPAPVVRQTGRSEPPAGGISASGNTGNRARPTVQQPDRVTPPQSGGTQPPPAQGGTNTVRPDEARPVFRDPVPAKALPDRGNPPSEARPVYRAPATAATTNRAAPPATAATKPEPKSEPQRTAQPERKPEPAPVSRAPASPPQARSAPPPPPPPPPPPATTSTRARPGSGGI